MTITIKNGNSKVVIQEDCIKLIVEDITVNSKKEVK